jgi:hypothetical protein
MTEHTLKTTVPPPDGWEYQGEFRHATQGEWYAWFGEARLCQHFTETCVPILRRARWVPKPGEMFWTVSEIGGAISWPGECCEAHPLRLSSGNYWRTREQAEAYAAACKELAERMHGEEQS